MKIWWAGRTYERDDCVYPEQYCTNVAFKRRSCSVYGQFRAAISSCNTDVRSRHAQIKTRGTCTGHWRSIVGARGPDCIDHFLGARQIRLLCMHVSSTPLSLSNQPVPTCSGFSWFDVDEGGKGCAQLVTALLCTLSSPIAAVSHAKIGHFGSNM